MNDNDIIKSAYEAAVKQVYNTFVTSCLMARTPAETQQAEQNFVRGIVSARQIRDRALALIP